MSEVHVIHTHNNGRDLLRAIVMRHRDGNAVPYLGIIIADNLTDDSLAFLRPKIGSSGPCPMNDEGERCKGTYHITARKPTPAGHWRLAVHYPPRGKLSLCKPHAEDYFESKWKCETCNISFIKGCDEFGYYGLPIMPGERCFFCKEGIYRSGCDGFCSSTDAGENEWYESGEFGGLTCNKAEEREPYEGMNWDDHGLWWNEYDRIVPIRNNELVTAAEAIRQAREVAPVDSRFVLSELCGDKVANDVVSAP